MFPRWWFCRALVFVVLLAVGPASTLADASVDLSALSQRIVKLIDEAKYSEAMPLAVRALALAERMYGSNHPEVGIAANNLAEIYEALGRYAEAEPLFKRDLEILEKVHGPEHPDVASSLNNLALLYDAQGRYAEAEPVAKRALAIREKRLGPDRLEVANSLSTLAGVYDNLGRYSEAEPLDERALAIREALLGRDHPDVGNSLNNLAALYESEGRYDSAEPLYKRAVTIFEKALGPDHPDLGASLNNLALLYKLEGRYAEAEPLYKRDLAINEKAFGPDHPNVASSLANLALLYLSQGRYADAEPLFKSSLEKRERALGLDHPAVAASLNSLGGLYYAVGRYAESEALLLRSLAVREKALGPDHREVGNALNNLAGLYISIGREKDAEPLLKRAISITENVYGPNHPVVATPLNNLALLYEKVGRYADAEPLALRSLSVREKALGHRHSDVAISLNTLARIKAGEGRLDEAETLYKQSISLFEITSGAGYPERINALNNLAALYYQRQDWAQAARTWRESTTLFVQRSKKSSETLGKPLTGETSEADENSVQFDGLIRATRLLADSEPSESAAAAREMFKVAQWAQNSKTAASLAQMSARQATGENALAHLVRERQDLVSEWQSRDKLFVSTVSKVQAERIGSAEEEQRARLDAIDARLNEIDQVLGQKFPEYAALAAPEPLAIENAQELLRPDEALVLFLVAPERKAVHEDVFVWAVTKTDMRWLHVSFPNASLAEAVSAVRCGLDGEAWTNGNCADLVKTPYTTADRDRGRPLPFNLATAHTLYKTLFGGIQDLIADKSLLIVPSGPLTALPFHVLVTAPSEASFPESAKYAGVAWLAKTNAVAVLPSVASLNALRVFAKVSNGKTPFIGFGNPLISGPYGRDRSAWEHQSCGAKASPGRSSDRAVRRSPNASLFRRGFADVEVIRAQYPLPETADELCAVAHWTGAADAAVYLGERATEKTVKTLSAAGTLGDARIVHFATHGLLASETELLTATTAEPALLLTPPKKATAEDDGLLTASEVAQLKLNADWVVLSACNTAAGEGKEPGTEALSGLARAFFYAGARSLLVSHWAVNSEATVKLITGAFAQLQAHPKAGRAEALRQSMLSLIASGGENAHPANWAPFILVGEGAL